MRDANVSDRVALARANASTILLASALAMNTMVLALGLVGLITSAHRTAPTGLVRLLGLGLLSHAILEVGALVCAVTIGALIIWRDILATGRLEDLAWSIRKPYLTSRVQFPPLSPRTVRRLYQHVDRAYDVREFCRALVIAPCAPPFTAVDHSRPAQSPGRISHFTEGLQLD